MSGARSELTTAVTLMRMALGLLDRTDESHAAIHLQRAIDVATRASVPRTVDEMEAWLEEDEACRAMLLDGGRLDESRDVQPPP